MLIGYIFFPHIIYKMDLPVTLWFAHHRLPKLTLIMKSITLLGDVPIVAILTLLAALILFFKYSKYYGIFFSLAIGVGPGVLNQVVKQIVQRPRPASIYRAVSVSSTSFPSGHSFVSNFFYPLLAFIFFKLIKDKEIPKWIKYALILIGIIVPISRVYLGVHYLSDVIAGTSLGLMTLSITRSYLLSK